MNEPLIGHDDETGGNNQSRRQFLRRFAPLAAIPVLAVGGYASYTYLWTSGNNRRIQQELRGRFNEALAEQEQAQPPPGLPARPVSVGVDAEGEPAVAGTDSVEASVDATRPQLGGQTVEHGAPLWQLELPSIGLDRIVVVGVNTASLGLGPGWWPGTASPGHFGNSVIAGHRTTHGAPFNDIDRVQVGDQVVVSDVDGRRWEYRVVQGPTVVESVDSPSLLRQQYGVCEVTLFSCHPKTSTRQRIFVRGELVDQGSGLPGDATGLILGQATF